jgi:hypothetical protein
MERYILPSAVRGPRGIYDISDEDGAILPRSSVPLHQDSGLRHERPGIRKRVLLFTMGFVIGALLFLIGGISWQPTPPKCIGCAILNSRIHNPQCTEAVQGGWTCEGR